MNKRLTLRPYWMTAATAFGLLVAGSVGILAATSAGPEMGLEQAQADQTTIPTAQKRLVCPAQPQLISGVGDGTDAAFAPGSSDEESALDTVIISDLAGNLPWVQLDGADLTDEVSESEQQGEPAVVSDEGESSRTAHVESTVGEALTIQNLVSYPLGSRPGLASATRSYSATDGDLAGLAAVDCLIPRHEQWITGMTTVVGATAVLNLTNPTDTTAVVSLEFFGGVGKVTAPGSSGIVIGPGETRSFLVAGFAPDEQAVSVRLRSSGGAVTAYGTQNYLYGLTAGGVDYLPATANLSRSQMVTGFVAQSESATADFMSLGGRSASRPALIISTPAATATEVTVTAYGQDGVVELPMEDTVVVPAQGTAELPLDSLPAGTYSFQLEADNLITATSRSIIGTEESDITYNSNHQSLSSTNVVALPQGSINTLVFGQAEGSSTVTITAIASDGEIGQATTLELEGSTTTRLTPAALRQQSGLSDVAGVLLSVSGDETYGAVSITGEDSQLSSLPIHSTQQANTSVPVSLSE